MTAEMQSPIPKRESKEESSKSRKSYKKTWVIVGGLAVVIIACAIACAAAIGTGIAKVFVERRPVELVLDSFMQDMLAGDIQNAYTKLSPRGQRNFSLSDLEELTEGNNFVIFDGYESLTVDNINISLQGTTNTDAPQGTIATVSGRVIYDGGITGQFNAVLEKVEGEWLIYGFNVVVPPSKFP